MQFRHPLFFLLLVLLPLLAYLRKKQSNSALRFSNEGAFRHLKPSWRVRASQVVNLFPFLILALFIVSLARPQAVNREREHETNGIDIVISLDISGSMLAEDFRPDNRLAVAKETAKDKSRMNKVEDGMTANHSNAMISLILRRIVEVLDTFLKHVLAPIFDSTGIVCRRTVGRPYRFQIRRRSRLQRQ